MSSAPTCVPYVLAQVDLLIVNGCDEFRLARVLLEIFTKLGQPDLLNATAQPQVSWSFVAQVIWIRGNFATSVLRAGADAVQQCRNLIIDGRRITQEWAFGQSAEELLDASINFLNLHGYSVYKKTITDMVFFSILNVQEP